MLSLSYLYSTSYFQLEALIANDGKDVEIQVSYTAMSAFPSMIHFLVSFSFLYIVRLDF